MDKKTVIIGGVLAALGVVALVVLSRGSGGNAAQSPAVAAPLQIPSYPQAPPLPALNVVATPYYQTFNVAPDRNLIQPTDKTAQSGSCGCKPCEQNNANAPAFSQAFVDKGAKSLQARFVLNAGNASNLIAQFPPYLYPWLYQNVGSA